MSNGSGRRSDSNAGKGGQKRLPLLPIFVTFLVVFLGLAWDCLAPTKGSWKANSIAAQDVFVKEPISFHWKGKEFKLLTGEVVVRRGSRISSRSAAILSKLQKEQEKRPLPNIFGILIILLALTTVSAVYVARRAPKSLESRERLLLFLVAPCAAVLSIKSLILAGAEPGVLILLNPIPATTILLSLVLDQEMGVAAVVFLAPIFGLLSGIYGRGTALTYALLGGVIGALSVSPRRSQRHDILKAGTAVGVLNATVLLAYNLLDHLPGSLANYEAIYGWCLPGFFNGVISAILVVGVVPLLERSFKVTTTTTMQELTSPSRPLLQRLINEAPGTYHHSTNVAYLAEGAAKEVGADAALAKAAAYYHDVGKLKRPYFFTENQMGGVNYHDNLSPHLSKLIITSHTKDGAELAKKAKLPAPIRDIIVQHHGTDLVHFFYHGAKQKEGKGAVEEHTFRYPGPKPQTKEAAVVMLADAAEAACRSLEKPAPTAIEKMVTKITNDRFVDGQFDECELTKKDIERIADSLSHNLSGMYHSRISYPEEDELLAKKVEKAQEAQ